MVCKEAGALRLKRSVGDKLIWACRSIPFFSELCSCTVELCLWFFYGPFSYKFLWWSCELWAGFEWGDVCNHGPNGTLYNIHHNTSGDGTVQACRKSNAIHTPEAGHAGWSKEWPPHPVLCAWDEECTNNDQSHGNNSRNLQALPSAIHPAFDGAVRTNISHYDGASCTTRWAPFRQWGQPWQQGSGCGGIWSLWTAEQSEWTTPYIVVFLLMNNR